METKKVEHPNHLQIVEFFGAERICRACNIKFTFGKTVGQLGCFRHIGRELYRNGEMFHNCCKLEGGSKGCSECDHTDSFITDTFWIVPFYYIKSGIVVKPDKSRMIPSKKVYAITEDSNGLKKEELDEFKTKINIKRIK